MSLPLKGKIILDLTRMLPGPYCSMILSDLGANVIRIEDPHYPYGQPPPFFQKGRYRESAFNSILNRNKKAITLNKIAIVDYSQCIKCYCCHEVCTYNAIKLEVIK